MGENINITLERTMMELFLNDTRIFRRTLYLLLSQTYELKYIVKTISELKNRGLIKEKYIPEQKEMVLHSTYRIDGKGNAFKWYRDHGYTYSKDKRGNKNSEQEGRNALAFETRALVHMATNGEYRIRYIEAKKIKNSFYRSENESIGETPPASVICGIVSTEQLNYGLIHSNRALKTWQLRGETQFANYVKNYCNLEIERLIVFCTDDVAGNMMARQTQTYEGTKAEKIIEQGAKKINREYLSRKCGYRLIYPISIGYISDGGNKPLYADWTSAINHLNFLLQPDHKRKQLTSELLGGNIRGELYGYPHDHYNRTNNCYHFSLLDGELSSYSELKKFCEKPDANIKRVVHLWEWQRRLVDLPEDINIHAVTSPTPPP